MTDEHAFVHDNLAAYLADGLSEGERARFDAHLNDCPVCFDAFSEARDADRGLLRTLAALGAEGDLEGRLVAGFRQRSAWQARRLVMRRSAYAAAAVLSLAALGVFAHFALRQGGVLSNPLSNQLVAQANEVLPGWSDRFEVSLAAAMNDARPERAAAAAPAMPVMEERLKRRFAVGNESLAFQKKETQTEGREVRKIEETGGAAEGKLNVNHGDGDRAYFNRLPEVGNNNDNMFTYRAGDWEKDKVLAAGEAAAPVTNWHGGTMVANGAVRGTGIIEDGGTMVTSGRPLDALYDWSDRKADASGAVEGLKVVTTGGSLAPTMGIIGGGGDGRQLMPNAAGKPTNALAALGTDVKGTSGVTKTGSGTLTLSNPGAGYTGQTATMGGYAVVQGEGQGGSQGGSQGQGGARGAGQSGGQRNGQGQAWGLQQQPLARADAPQGLGEAPATRPAGAAGAGGAPAGAAEAVQAVQAQRKIIRNATVEYEVRSFDDTYQTISSITTEEGGFVASSSSDRLANGKVRGTMVVRVPPDHVERFLMKIRALGELKSQQIGSSDVTKQYTDTESELRGLRTMETRLIDLIKSGRGEVKDLVEAEKQLGEYRVRIEKLEGEIRYYNNLVSMATLTITAYEKDIQKPTAASEQETIGLSLQTEEVEAKYAAARAILAEAKARIVESQLKNTDAEHTAAKIVADVPPDKSDFVAAQLKQLGVLANFERDRRQTTTGGTGAPAPSVQPEVKDTRISVLLFNLANLQPRETVVMTVAVTDVESAYAALVGALRGPTTQPAPAGGAGGAAQASSRVIASNLNGQQPEQMTADVRAELRGDAANADLVMQALRNARETGAAGGAGGEPGMVVTAEVLSSTITQNQDTANTTAAKRGLTVRLVNVATVAPRETQNLRLVAGDVVKAYEGLLGVLRPLAEQKRARIVNSQLSQSDPRNVRASLTFEVRREALAEVDRALASAGIDVLGRTISRATNTANTLDSKVLFQVEGLQSAESLEPRRTFSLGYESENVNAAMDSLRMAAAGMNGVKELDYTVSKDPTGRVIGRIVLDVPVDPQTRSSAPVMGLLDKVRSLGTERDTQISKNPNVPETRFARDRIDLTLSSRPTIVKANEGVGTTLRAALSTAFAALTYSLYLVVTGVLFVLPFALVLWVVRLIWRRRRPAEAAAG